MRTVGIVLGLGAAVAIAACLDAGLHPPTVARAQPRTPAGPARVDPSAAPTAPSPVDDLVPAVATVPAPPVVATAAAPPAPTQVEHVSPNGVSEKCKLLQVFPFTPADVTADPKTMRWYRKDDFEDIEKLCAIDLYKTTATAGEAIAGVCPKTHWSTPALELFDLGSTKLSKTQFETARCPRWRHRGASKLAKIKIPVYDKEPESALMYFHFSRLLGNAGLIYPATHRTVDRKKWIDWSRAAIDYISKFTTTATPLGGWQVLRGRHQKRKNVDTVYGSLAKNPRGEHSHHAFTSSNNVRLGSPSQFRRQPYFKLVNSKQPIAEQLDFDATDPEDYREDIQRLAYAADFTNLVIMDHLFNQRDRAGNVNARNYHHYINDDGQLRWKKELDKDNTHVTVELERLILKDNDDGLIWDLFGRMNSTPLIPDLRHLDSIMYARMQWLAGLMRDPGTKDHVRSYFVDQVEVKPDTYDEVRERFLKMAERFERWHDEGRLMLDLDLDLVIAGAPPMPTPDPAEKGKRKYRHRSKTESDKSGDSTKPADKPAK